jgi:hypothetical protein
MHALVTMKQDLTPFQIIDHVVRRHLPDGLLPSGLAFLMPSNPVRRSTRRLSVAPQRQGVVSLPGLSAAGTCVVVAVALVETTRLLASGSEATSLAVLVNGVDDPVDAGILANGLVLRVDEDHLVILVGRVLVDPV